MDPHTPTSTVPIGGEGNLPPPPTKPAVPPPGNVGTGQNLDPLFRDAASSTDSSKDSHVLRERTQEELYHQLTIIKEELARRQSRAADKRPAGQVTTLPINPALAETPRPPPQPYSPTHPQMEIAYTVPELSLRRTPSVRARADSLQDEDDVQQRKHHRFEDMRELVRREVAEAGLQLSKYGPSTAIRMSLSPLSPDILGVRFPKKFTAPSFDYYKGTTDPLQHLRHYQDRMAVYSYDDALLCRMFPSSLKGLASDWFYSLKPRSLTNFEQVAQAFLAQYSSCQEYRRNSNHLFTVKMTSDEGLKGYLTRFQTERAKIQNCSDDVAAAAFISGLLVNHDFYASLVKHNVTDMHEILRRAPGYIQLEEARRITIPTKAPEKARQGGHKTQNNKPDGVSSEQRPPYFNNQRTFPQNVRESVRSIQASTFNTPMNHIFRIIKNQPWVRRPPPLPPTERNLNSPDYCEYHEASGHQTVSCRALLTFLQSLLRQGYLKEYALSPLVDQTMAARPDTRRDVPALTGANNQPLGPAPPQYKIVNAIYGATLVDGLTNKERRIHINQARRDTPPGSINNSPSNSHLPITFTDRDVDGVRYPHNDALVITVPIGNCLVSRVLVDTGSSVNIMYGQTLDHMEDSVEAARALIQPQPEPLYGFDGSQAISPGIVSYPVRADPFNIITRFHVVNIASPHNIILGRPWIHQMKAVTSTYHQIVRYPTPDGHADIRGDQGVSRSCSAIALKRSGWTLRDRKEDQPETKKPRPSTPQ